MDPFASPDFPPSFPSTPTSLADLVGAVSPELSRLLGELMMFVEQPISLSLWREQVNALYQAKARTTRLRMAQALEEVLALAGPDATTKSLSAELVGRLAARGGAASTTNGLLSSLRRACRIAVKARHLHAGRLEGCVWRIRDSNGAKGVYHPRKDIAKVLDWLAQHESTWDGARLQTLASIYAYTGVRKTEALRLRVADVDLKRGFLFVTPNGEPLKTEDSAAPVPCPRVLVRILRAWIGRCNSEWLIPNKNRVSPWTGGSTGRRATDRLVAAGRAVEVDGFTPLSLRHSLATHYTSHWGLSTKQVQMILRHSNETTQARYIHPDLVNLGEMVRDFDFEAPRASRSTGRPRRSERGHGHLFRRKTRRPRTTISVASPAP